MPHIHTEPGQHDLTTTAFIISTDGPEPRAFLHMHKRLKLLLPVGGHVELLETPWGAVLHEIAEEAGFEADQLQVLQPKERILKMDGVKTHPVPLFLQTHVFGQTDHHHIDIGFLFVTSQSPRHQPSDGESTDLRWLTANEVAQQKADMPPDIAQIYDFAFTTALQTWSCLPLGEFDA